MRGPLNTNNIRAQDGTLAASIDDGTGNVTFQNDVEVSNDLNVDRDATIFRNLEVQGPLSTFIQSISVGVDAAIGQDLTVGQDTDITRDLAVGRNADVVSNLTVGTRVETVNLRMTGNGPAAGKLLTAVDANGNVTWGSGGTAGIASVPTGESILFNTNNTVLGYTILDVSDDDVVYVTKGTIHGGQAGGAAKPGSTWSHFHSKGTLAGSPHTHTGTTGYETGNGTNRKSGGTNSHYHNFTTDPASVPIVGNTGTNTTWRPKGRNFTLQQRN
jgi:hypothetical protein